MVAKSFFAQGNCTLDLGPSWQVAIGEEYVALGLPKGLKSFPQPDTGPKASW